MLIGSPTRAAAAATRLIPGSAGSSDTPARDSMIRIATVPGVRFQSSIVSTTAGSAGSTGLISANRLGHLRCTAIA